MEREMESSAGEIAEPKKQRRGFGAMDRTKVREIARLGGTAAHRKGTAHRFTQEEARRAGSKGGKAPHRTRGRQRPTGAIIGAPPPEPPDAPLPPPASEGAG